MVPVVKPVSDALALIVAEEDAAPLFVCVKVARVDEVPYWKLGVVEVPPVEMVPSIVAVVEPIAEGDLVVTETPPTELATFPDVNPPTGRIAASSLAD